jgi:hypothetical protein
LIDTAVDAAINVKEAGGETEVYAIVADKSDHSAKVLKLAADLRIRTSIREPDTPTQR